MTLKKVRRIFKLQSWASITVKDADALRAACGIIPGNEFRQTEYLKRTLSIPFGLRHFERRPPSARIAASLRLKALFESAPKTTGCFSAADLNAQTDRTR